MNENQRDWFKIIIAFVLILFCAIIYFFYHTPYKIEQNNEAVNIYESKEKGENNNFIVNLNTFETQHDQNDLAWKNLMPSDFGDNLRDEWGYKSLSTTGKFAVILFQITNDGKQSKKIKILNIKTRDQFGREFNYLKISTDAIKLITLKPGIPFIFAALYEFAENSDLYVMDLTYQIIFE
jgi:hypothetical protein